MTVRAGTLTDGYSLIEAPLRAALDRLDPATRHVCGYHLGYWNADASPADGGGKGIRPTLAILSARAANAGDDIGIPAALACELIHNFSLLHDDVMDGDTERRHRRTAWAEFGESAAILAGDALSSLAGELLAESPSATASWAIRCVSAATRRLIAGQAADLAFESRDVVPLGECLTMSDDKTGALMACSASLGAVLADAPAELATGLADYGAHLGLAFQLTDDLLGIWGDPARTGKSTNSDLQSRKKSVPAVYALQTDSRAGERLREIYTNHAELDDERIAEAAALIAATGAQSWTRQRVDAEIESAVRCIDALSMPYSIAEEFTQLARRLGGRDY